MRTRALPSYAAIAIVASLVSVGCSGEKWGPQKGAQDAGGGEAAGEEEDRGAPVKVVALTHGAIEASVSSASTIDAERQVTVHAEATGTVLAVAFEEGDVVRKGAVLAKIRRDMQASSVDRASANLEKAQRDLERVKSLQAQGAVSDEEVASVQLALRSAEIDVRDRRRDLSNTKVVAPFDGTITDRFVNSGAFVTSGQQLYGITDFSSLVARVYVPERELDRIRVGQRARVVGKAATGRNADGTVMRIAPKIDAATGTVKITVSLPAPAEGAPTFLPGMYAEVVLTTDRRENVLLVPKTALIREEERAFVFTLAGDKVERKLLGLGLANENYVEVLSGIAATDRVVVAGQTGLKDGATVHVVDTTRMPETDAGSASGGAGADQPDKPEKPTQTDQADKSNQAGAM